MERKETQSAATCDCGMKVGARDRWLAGLSMMAGAALGAGFMYLWDPNRGRIRRAQIQQQAAHMARKGRHEMLKRTEDLLNRAKGVFAGADAGVATDGAVDEVMVGRVRSHMGHVMEHASDVETEVTAGVVTLRGTVAPDKHRRLVKEVLAVPGVKGVRDLLVAAASA